MADPKKLARIHRVRTLQLNLKHADEARAREKFASEATLAQRIGALADAVSPTPESALGASLGAAAHFRERLHQSAAAAQNRVLNAEVFVSRAAEATRAAKRDQTAVEKLIDRARAQIALKDMRKLEEAPPARSKRHDPC